jgi:SulP family sulfate permease
LALLIVLLGAGAYAKLIPLPVLAGILITVGIGIIDYKGIKHIPHVPKTDSIIMLVVLTMTVFVDLLQAVAVGMVLASVLFMKKMGDIVEQQSAMGLVSSFTDEKAWDDELNISEKVHKQVYINHFNGPMFFGFASKFQEITSTMPDVTVVIMRMARVPYIDQSGIYAIEDAVITLKERGIIVLMTGLQEQPKDMLSNIGLIFGLIPKEHMFKSFSQCIAALEAESVKADPGKSESIVWNLN